YSPSSIAFYHADRFPEHYRGGAFVTLKGSWNRAPMPQDGYVVAFVPFSDGAPTGQWQTFADGFKGFGTLYERGNAVYRPQSVAIHPDGSLYVLDNNKGRIWRITYTGNSGISAPSQPDNDRSLIVTASQGPGSELYLRYCAACHQAEGGGIPGEVPPLTNTEWVSGDKGRLIRSVLHGMQGRIEINGVVYDDIMPGHGLLDDEQLAALLTFVRSTFGHNPDPVHESEVVLVRNADKRTTLWMASDLWQQQGLTGAQRKSND
ncbi:MAG: c-type cytochrome, partial [Gammaproteobacteria bacterium]|nr:c-type cytochrome [Gammaproteobacteria bacterium]